jgi:hypothetical protein
MKLCPRSLASVLAALLIGACVSSETVATVDTWAKRACRLIEALPEASASTLPPSVVVNVNVTPSVAVATVSASASSGAPLVAVSALALPMAPMTAMPTDGGAP